MPRKSHDRIQKPKDSISGGKISVARREGRLGFRGTKQIGHKTAPPMRPVFEKEDEDVDVVKKGNFGQDKQQENGDIVMNDRNASNPNQTGPVQSTNDQTSSNTVAARSLPFSRQGAFTINSSTRVKRYKSVNQRRSVFYRVLTSSILAGSCVTAFKESRSQSFVASLAVEEFHALQPTFTLTLGWQ